MDFHERGSRPALGFPVTDNTWHDQVGIVHDGAERHSQGIAQFATLVNGAGGLGVNMTSSKMK